MEHHRPDARLWGIVDSPKNDCAWSSVLGGQARYCNGPVQQVTSGCGTAAGVTNYQWPDERTLVSPAVTSCKP